MIVGRPARSARPTWVLLASFLVVAACAAGVPRPSLPDPAAITGRLTLDDASAAVAGADAARLTGYLGGRALRLSVTVGDGLATTEVVAVELDVTGIEGTGAQERTAVLTTLRRQPTGVDAGGGLEPDARSGADCTATLADGLESGTVACGILGIGSGESRSAFLEWTSEGPQDVAPLSILATWELSGAVQASGAATVWTSRDGLVRDADGLVVLPQLLVAGAAHDPTVLRVVIRGSDGNGTADDIEAVVDDSVTESVLYVGTPIGRIGPDLVLAASTDDDEAGVEFADCIAELSMDALQGELRCERGGPVGQGSSTLHLVWEPGS